VRTLEALTKSSENFPGDFEVNQRLGHLRITSWRSKGKHFEKLNSEAVGAITNSLLIATRWRVARDYA